MFFDRGTFRVLPLTYCCIPKSARAYLFPNLSEFLTFAAAPLVLTPFLRNQGLALGCVSEKLRGDREVVMEAVRQNGLALEHASEELRGDREVVMEAVRQIGSALQHASEELKDDREILMEAVKHIRIIVRTLARPSKRNKKKQGFRNAALAETGRRKQEA